LIRPWQLWPHRPELPEAARQIPLRLDYALANDALRKYGPRAFVRRDALTERMSDHFPIRVAWAPRAEGGGEGASGANLTFYERGAWR